MGRTVRGMSVCALVAAATLGSSTYAQSDESVEVAPAASQLSTEIETFVDGVVTQSLARNRIAGAQVALVRNGEVILAKGYGIDAIEPERRVDPARSLFKIGSITKTFLWIALMQLEERGVLQLTDPINDRLPPELQVSNDGFATPIRILDLMNHTAGFEDGLQGLFQGDESKLLPLVEHLQKYRVARVREPGTIMSYSNYGTALAGAIVAHVSGMEYETYVEQRILAPLGMNRTTLREHYGAEAAKRLPAPMSPELATDRAVGLEWLDGRWVAYPQEHLVSVAPAGSAVSTSNDMAKYLQALLDPSLLEAAGVLRQETLQRMRSPSFRAAPGMPAQFHGFFNMALGQKASIDVDNLSHPGSTLHFFSTLILIPELPPPAEGSLGIFLSTNSKSGAQLRNELPERIMTKFFPTGRVQPQLHPQASRERGSLGWFRNLRRSDTKLEGLSAAFNVIAPSRRTDGVVELGGGGTVLRFVEEDVDQFRQIDGDARFALLRDEDGDVTHLAMSVGSFAGTFDRVHVLRSPLWILTSIAFGIVVAVLVVIATLIRLRRPSEQASWERRAAYSATLAALAWIAFVALLAAFGAGISGPGTEERLLYSYPQPLLKVALSAALLGAIATAATLAFTIPALREGHWSRWRRLRHIIVVVAFTVLTATLADWNVIGFKYF